MTDHTTVVKICGIRSPDTLLGIKNLPIDYIGFVFARSKRQVTPETAGELIQVLRSEGLQNQGGFQSVGVFVNPGLEELKAILEQAPLDVIQLHGQETPEFCQQVRERFPKAKLFKAVPIPEAGLAEGKEQAADLIQRLLPYVPVVDAFLLDTYDPVIGGGSGRTFSWDMIPSIRDWARKVGCQLLIAGGLHEENVGELLTRYGPDGVDVSSGVETEGVKDIGKITRFVERVKPG